MGPMASLWVTSIYGGVNVGKWIMNLACGRMSAGFSAGESITNGKSGAGTGYCELLGAASSSLLLPGSPPRSATTTQVSEGLIMVWRDDRLLDALGKMREDVNSIPVGFDISADRRLVELLLAWRARLFRDGARVTRPNLGSRRSAAERHSSRGDHRERVGSGAAATEEDPSNYPSSFVPGHLEAKQEDQRRERSPSSWRKTPIVKLINERGLDQ
jgi:hypothetical protein